MHRTMRGALARRARLLAGVGMAICCAGPALAAPHTDTYVQPYIEVDQVLDAPLSGGGDVLTYTDVAAGIDAGVHTQRVEAQVSYRYEHRFGESGDVGDGDIHSGIARARAEIVPGHLSVEAGGFASRENDDFGNGKFKGLATQGGKNVSQVYAAYVQPKFQQEFGEVHAKASYLLGYVNVDDNNDRVFTSQDRFGHATEQQGMVLVGQDPEGSLPFGWNVGGTYRREDLGQLSQRFQQENVIGEIVFPVTPTLALLADVGYEKITSSQQAVLFDTTTGLPVINGNGSFVVDPTGGRITFYNQSGLVYEGGFIWHPSQRTRLEARAGHRYGGTTITAAFDHSFSPEMAIHAEVFDGIDSFGRGLTSGLASLPTSFTSIGSPIIAGGCVFGTKPGSGGCLNLTGLIGTANYRNRGVIAMLSGHRGRTDFGIGFGYSNRRFIGGRNGVDFTIQGATDQSYIVQAYFMRALSERSSLRGDLFGGRFVSSTSRIDSLWSEGATLSYSQLLMPHLDGQATGGLFATQQAGAGNSGADASLLLGLRYSF